MPIFAVFVGRVGDGRQEVRTVDQVSSRVAVVASFEIRRHLNRSRKVFRVGQQRPFEGTWRH